MNITRLDHLVLSAADSSEVAAAWRQVFGLRAQPALRPDGSDLELTPLPLNAAADETHVLDDPLDPPEVESGSESKAQPALQEARLIGPALALPEEGQIPRLWVDTRDLQVRRIDRSSGVFTIFGPIIHFEKLQVPAWFEIHAPGEPTIRFDVDRAVQVNAPPQAFSRSWLLAPTDPKPDPPTEAQDSLKIPINP